MALTSASAKFRASCPKRQQDSSKCIHASGHAASIFPVTKVKNKPQTFATCISGMLKSDHILISSRFIFKAPFLNFLYLHRLVYKAVTVPVSTVTKKIKTFRCKTVIFNVQQFPFTSYLISLFITKITYFGSVRYLYEECQKNNVTCILSS